MSRISFVVVALLFSLLVGCTTYSNKHFALMDAPLDKDRPAVIETIRASIEPILSRYQLKNRKFTSTPENVLLYYSTGGNVALRVGFREFEGNVIFDAFQYHPGISDTETFTNLVDEILMVLKDTEGFNIVETTGPVI